jgi:hypothetical protein
MIENEVKSREIEHLWHFTKVENLDSILKSGMMPRAMLEAQSANVAYNDEHRLDYQKTANCLSLGHPNYKMFYRLRRVNPNQGWVVLGIDPEVLWIKDCAFCDQNAATGSVASTPIAQRKGLQAFQKMFFPVAGKPDRGALGLPDDCPTNPQAEILVYGVIEPKYIVGAITQTKAIENELIEKYPEFEFLYHRAHFSARKDYEHW